MNENFEECAMLPLSAVSLHYFPYSPSDELHKDKKAPCQQVLNRIIS